MNFDKIYNIVNQKIQEWLNTIIQMLPNIAVAVIVMIIFYLIGKLFKNIISKILRRFSSHVAVNRLISQLIFLSIFFIGLFVALGILNLDKTVTALLAGAGIIGLALGFAFKDIAANLISGILLSIRSPFKIDDIIKSNDYFGTVKKITLQNIHIITP